MNVTVTEPSAASFLTAWPSGEPRPNASNLNYVAGQTVPNLVVVKVGTDGKVNLHNALGSTHVVADVVGWYSDASVTTGARYRALSPARILDTRTGNGAPRVKLGPNQTLALQVTGRGGVPFSGVSAVVMNVTVTEPSAASVLTAWPTGEARPNASNLNYVAGQTVPNLVVVKVGTDGKVSFPWLPSALPTRGRAASPSCPATQDWRRCAWPRQGWGSSVGTAASWASSSPLVSPSWSPWVNRHLSAAWFTP
ncbi:MAG: hypothetical protein ACR2G7_08300 [Acidimicrobiales bacterium]